MSATIITAGDSSALLAVQGGDDGTLVIKTGAAGSKVNAVVYAADGTPTQIKGTTLGSAPTPVPSGSAPIYGVRAWCTFNGVTTGTNAPISGGNVSTVTRNGVGDYTVNFATAMPNANYALSGLIGTTNVRCIVSVSSASTNLTTTTARINTIDPQTSAAVDEAFVSLMFIV